MKRRDFLLSASAVAGGAMLNGIGPRAAAAAVQAPRKLTIATRTIEVNGKSATVYGLTGPDGRPGLTFSPGEAFRVDLDNRLAEETIVHWHGLLPPVEQDGVPDNPLPKLKPGEIRAYDFPIHHPGTYWMHAHTLQEQNLLAAPLIVRSAEDLAADSQEVVLLLHDFSFTPAEELLAGLTGGQSAMDHSQGHMDMGNMDMGSMDMGNMDMGHMDGMMGGMDLNDIQYDAYLANDRTLDDPEVVRVDKGGRVRLRIINGATSTGFTIATGGLPARLVAVDGKPVEPLDGSAFPISMGQRLDIAVEIPVGGGAFPILALREGAPERTGLILATAGATVARLAPIGEAAGPVLDLSVESRLKAVAPFEQRTASQRHMVHLMGNMMGYQWGMMGAEAIRVTSGERIEVAMMNMSMMAHPMHLHGHEFQVIGIDGKSVAGAVRDTVLVPPMRTVTIAFDGGSKGNWPFHCHHLYHMVRGMMVHMPVT